MKVRRREAMSDVAFGAVAAGVVALLMFDSADLGERAKLFPVAVLWCLLIAALAVLTTGLLNLRHDKVQIERSFDGGWMKIIAPPLLVIAGGAMLVWFGFYVMSPVFIFAMHALHMRLSTGAVPNRRMLLSGLTLAIVATGVMYLIFDILIGLPAPSGTFF